MRNMAQYWHRLFPFPCKGTGIPITNIRWSWPAHFYHGNSYSQGNFFESVTIFPRREFPINTLRPRQNGRHFPDDIFRCIFFNENVSISIMISLKFVPKGPVNNIPALIQIMAWRRPGDKPLSEPMMVRLPTHMCVTRPQWVKKIRRYPIIVRQHPYTGPDLPGTEC